MKALSLGWDRHKVHVGVHETPGPDLDLVEIRLNLENFQIGSSVLVREEDLLVPVASLDDVVGNTFYDDSGDPWHNDDKLSLQHKGVKKSSSPGEFHPQALTEPDVNLSIHPALIIQTVIQTVLLDSSAHPTLMVDQRFQLGRCNPFAPSLLGDFTATTGCSAPVLCIGTIALVGSPLVTLALTSEHMFPRSIPMPVSSSRHLHAGRHPSSSVRTGFVSWTYPWDT